jgi:hypothetical protein
VGEETVEAVPRLLADVELSVDDSPESDGDAVEELERMDIPLLPVLPEEV